MCTIPCDDDHEGALRQVASEIKLLAPHRATRLLQVADWLKLRRERADQNPRPANEQSAGSRGSVELRQWALELAARTSLPTSDLRFEAQRLLDFVLGA